MALWKADVLVINETGYIPLDRMEADIFRNLASDLYERSSVMIASKRISMNGQRCQLYLQQNAQAYVPKAEMRKGVFWILKRSSGHPAIRSQIGI